MDEQKLPVAADGDMPRDAKIVTEILESMGVESYEPRVVNQLLTFMYRYVTDVLSDATVYSDHAKKASIDMDDVRLAIQSRVNVSFTQPPPREVLMELARIRNAEALPEIQPRSGIRLPFNEEGALVAPTYQVIAASAGGQPSSNQ